MAESSQSQMQTIIPPEGYTLVKKADFEACQEHMKGLTRAVNTLKESMIWELEVNIVKAMREQKTDGNPRLAVDSLSEKFAVECKKSRLKSALETSRSEFKKKSLMNFSKSLSEKINHVQKSAQQQIEKEVQSAAENVKKSLREQDAVITEEIQNAALTNYRGTVQNVLLPGMQAIYRNHCKDLHSHLLHHFHQLEQTNGSHEIRQRMDMIMKRLTALERGDGQAIMDPNFEERVNSHLNDIMAKTVEARGEEDPQAQITTLIEREEYQLAMFEALTARDISVLLETCKAIDPEQLFAVTPKPAIPLCLVHQLTESDLQEDTELKLEYIGQSVMVFQSAIRKGNYEYDRSQMENVLRPLMCAIDDRIPRNKTAKMLKLVIVSILDQI